MNKSIAGFRIFNDENDFSRMKNNMRYYLPAGEKQKFSQFLRDVKIHKENIADEITKLLAEKSCLVQVIAYCVMPTHFHLVLKQMKENGIENYLTNISNAYSHYFNTKIERKGPLWVGRFKSVLVESDNQLIHLTRYIHLNPVSAGLVANASDWKYSSYAEYVDPGSVKYPICDFQGLISFTGDQYKKFVDDQADYQRELEVIKHLSLE
jgi:putative transposase